TFLLNQKQEIGEARKSLQEAHSRNAELKKKFEDAEERAKCLQESTQRLEEKLSNIESKNQVLCSPTGKSCHLLENPYLQDREQLLFRELQKMGMATMEKKRWLHHEAVGQSGRILSVWDPNKFQKLNHTISDYCILVLGVWVPNGRKLLIILIYAPQELSEKRTLWDYLCFTICNWNGDVVTMGDFNEVRDSSERFNSVFNKHGAELFNDFIAKAGLTEVPLGGCIFTWCHKTASKMSKLDRFLVSDSLLCNCPRISSVTLDRYLSDHRPILMRESIYDYGPIPFKFYHYWFEIDGFDKLVEDSWNEIHVVDNNAYVRFMKKLKLLKERIKAWNSSYRELKNCRKNTLKTELTNLDSVLDRGEGIDTDVTRRSDVVRILQDIEKTEAMEVAQKAKIKWAVEGDENSKYYHGVINKKRNNLAIRVEHCTCKDALIRSPTGIGAGLGEHLAPMERPNKILIGDRGGFGA
ncbi:RNA-directed DNA polymerase, eukaryota, partial [Tanacetum coccineum]